MSDQSEYSLARSHSVAVLGRFTVGAGLVVTAVVILVALAGDLPRAVAVALLLLTVVALALAAVAAVRVLRPPTVLLLTGAGYRVKVLRGVGPTEASWRDVARVRRQQLGPGPCLVVSLTDGGHTVVPLRLLEGGVANADSLEADLRGRLDQAHGQRRLNQQLGNGQSGGGGI